jgi:hypothetical protein
MLMKAAPASSGCACSGLDGGLNRASPQVPKPAAGESLSTYAAWMQPAGSVCTSVALSQPGSSWRRLSSLELAAAQAARLMHSPTSSMFAGPVFAAENGTLKWYFGAPYCIEFLLAGALMNTLVVSLHTRAK